MEGCIFCKIVKGKAPSHKIWEDEKHLAFLSIFPNTEGFSVVITKEHYPSYAFGLPEEVFIGLIKAAKEVAKVLDAKLEDVGRTGMIFEGFVLIMLMQSFSQCMVRKCHNGSHSNQMSINTLRSTRGIFHLMITNAPAMKD